jgi:hypothetical protein
MDSVEDASTLHALYDLEDDMLLLSTGSNHAPLDVVVDEQGAPQAVPRTIANRYYRKPGPPGFCAGASDPSP